MDTKSGPTWDRYVAVIRPWFTYAAAASSPALPADPATFAAWLAAAGAQDRGYAQTKTRCVAISALCALVGAPSPEAHHLVRAYRTAARRNKRFRRGSVTPLFRSELPLPPTEPPQGAPQLARRAGLSPDERLRQRAATARHMALMHDAALRFDDTREGQLGDILHSPDVVEINIFGSKTDPLLRGQVAVLPGAGTAPNGTGDGPSGLLSLLETVRTGLRRLESLPPAVLRPMGVHLRAAVSPRDPSTGPEAMATWPADIQSLALPLYGLGLQVHTLPYYGPWLWEHLHADFDLSRTCSTHQFQRWSRGTLLASGVTIGRFGAHSMRRGSAAELARGAIGDVALARVLRHSTPASSAPYVMAAVHSANTAAAMRAASRPGPDPTPRPAGGGRARHAPPGPPPGGYPRLGDLPV